MRMRAGRGWRKHVPPQAVKEQSERAWLSDVPPIPNGKQRVRQHVGYTNLDLVSETYEGGHKGVHPRLLELVPNTREVKLWPANAKALINTELKRFGRSLLGRIANVLTDSAFSQGWGDVPTDRALCLLQPLSDMHPTTRELTPVCMPVDRERAKGEPYFSIVKGYCQLNFGMGMKNRGRWGKVQEEVYMYAHHVVCWLFYGPPPSTKHVCGHLCGYSNCLNPRHLKWMTKSEDNKLRSFHKNQRGQVPPQYTAGMSQV